jgi:hypothetical protein
MNGHLQAVMLEPATARAQLDVFDYDDWELERTP